MSTNWFLDFDDTLVTGSSTWSLKYAFPKLIEKHQLSYDEGTFKEAILIAQEKASQNPNPNPDPILTELFEKLGWPLSLKIELLEDLMTYKPQVFEDTLPFLTRLQAREDRIFVISNNPYAPDIAGEVGLHQFVEQFFTPKRYPGTRPKPDRSLWDCVLQKYPDMDHDESVILGDDPWSEGAFADSCGLTCVIIDRRQMYTSLYRQKPYQWIQSLLDLTRSAG